MRQGPRVAGPDPSGTWDKWRSSGSTQTAGETAGGPEAWGLERPDLSGKAPRLLRKGLGATVREGQLPA